MAEIEDLGKRKDRRAEKKGDRDQRLEWYRELCRYRWVELV